MSCTWEHWSHLFCVISGHFLQPLGEVFPSHKSKHFEWKDFKAKRSTSGRGLQGGRLARLCFCFFRIHKLKILDVCYWHLVNICFWDIKYRKYSSLGTGLDWLTDFIKQISTFMLMTTLYPGRYMSDSLPLQQEGFMTIHEWNLGDFGCLWVLFSHCVDSVTHTLIGWFII